MTETPRMQLVTSGADDGPTWRAARDARRRAEAAERLWRLLWRVERPLCRLAGDDDKESKGC